MKLCPDVTVHGNAEAGGKALCIPILACIAVIAYLLLRQGVQGVPVPTRPLEGEVHSGPTVRLCWNPTGHEDVEVQVGEDRRFGKILCEQRVQDTWFSLTPAVFVQPGRYYWRMRHIKIDGPGPWTRAIRFRIE